MSLYRSRSQPVEAWQYNGDGNMPQWAWRACLVINGELVLERLSGRQLLNRGEWLVKDLDGGVLFLTADEFEEHYEPV